MIILTKQGDRQMIPYLFAYDRGVFIFEFTGDATYTDPFDGSVWIWDNTFGLDEILGVFYGNLILTQTTSFADCLLLEGSWFWDNTTKILYVHWINAVNDYTIDRSIATKSVITAGYISGYHVASKNFFDNIYYETRISELTGLARNVDPTKLGLLAFREMSLTFTDQRDTFLNQIASEIIGVPLWIYAVPEDVTILTNEYRIFTGFISGYSHTREKISYLISEIRLFQNKTICQNSINLTEWPDAGEMEGKLKPVAWGDIRRGKMIPVNSDTLTTDNPGTAIFLVADPVHAAVLGIDAVYDKEDNVIAINATDLDACTVEVTKPAGVSVSDLEDWKWQGQGYDIDGTYNNGLDIIRSAFLFFTKIPFITSTFEVVAWNAVTAANPEAVGISIQSDKGFTEELIEPICTSLQGSVTTLGDGRITYLTRNIEAEPEFVAYANIQTDLPEEKLTSSNVVSTILIQYSPDFVADKALQIDYTADRSYVMRNYNIDRREPLSPVKTVLVEQSDAEALAAELSQTSADPERTFSVELTVIIDLQPFNIIGIDIGLFQNPEYVWCEILSFVPNYLTGYTTITARVIPDYEPTIYVDGFLLEDRLFEDACYGAPIGYLY